MSVQTEASLPPNVRVHEVAKVLGILHGCNASMMKREGWVEVPGANVLQVPTVPEMVLVELRARNGSLLARYHYHFEGEGGRHEGGRRLVRADATPTAIAAMIRLVAFFGGRVTYADHSESGERRPDLPDEKNCPDDGAPWHDLQRRILAEEPISPGEREYCVRFAAYRDDEPA